MSEWKKARKKSIVIEVREVKGKFEEIETLNGTVVAEHGKDLIVKGVNGELYPIALEIFNKTYEWIDPT